MLISDVITFVGAYCLKICIKHSKSVNRMILNCIYLRMEIDAIFRIFIIFTFSLSTG